MSRYARKFSTAFLYLVAICFASPALAQWSSGLAGQIEREKEIRSDRFGDVKRGADMALGTDGIPIDRDTSESLRAVHAASEAARCVVSKAGADEILSTQPGTANARTAFERLMARTPGCDTSKISRLLLWRGLLSEAAYLERFPSARPLSSLPDPERLRTFRAMEYERNDARGEFERLVADIAGCLVMSDLSLADRLARSRHGEEEEAAILAAMIDLAPYCIDGQDFAGLGKSYRRAFLMESLYRATL